MKQEMYGSGISWTICKQSAPRSRQITTPTPHHSTTTSVSHHISSSLCCRFSVFSDSERLCHCCQLPNNFGLCWIFRIFHNGLEDAPKTCPFPRGTWAPHVPFLGPTQVYSSLSGISVGSAVLAILNAARGCVHQSHRPRLRACDAA